MSVKIIEMLAPVIANGARSGLKRTKFKGVTIHNTGNKDKGANAKAHGARLQGSGKRIQTSWHYAVDEDYAVRSIPENEVSWHAGDGLNGVGNRQTVSIEICMNNGGDIEKATDNAAKLTADILKRNGIKKAVSKQNVFQHYHWSGKNCPQMIRVNKPYSWNKFIEKVNSYLNPKTVKEIYRVRKTWADEKSQKGAYSVLDIAKKTCDKYAGYKVYNSKGKAVYTSKAVAKSTATKTTTTYKVVTEINGYRTAANAKNKKNAVGKVAADTYYVFNKASGMINVTSKKGKAGSWINPADNVVKKTTTTKTTSKMTEKQFALEVWNKGMHGTGKTREANAKKYGLNYAEVQRLIGILAKGGKI